MATSEIEVILSRLERKVIKGAASTLVSLPFRNEKPRLNEAPISFVDRVFELMSASSANPADSRGYLRVTLSLADLSLIYAVVSAVLVEYPKECGELRALVGDRPDIVRCKETLMASLPE